MSKRFAVGGCSLVSLTGLLSLPPDCEHHAISCSTTISRALSTLSHGGCSRRWVSMRATALAAHYSIMAAPSVASNTDFWRWKKGFSKRYWTAGRGHPVKVVVPNNFRHLMMCLSARVCIKGSSNDEAVLCSSSTTYAVKYVSTSNTVLLVSPEESYRPTETESGDDGPKQVGHGNGTVVATVGGYVELVETAPRIEKLKNLLTQNPYKEEDDNTETGHGVAGTARDENLGLYSWDYLSSNVQASDQELEGALKELGAVQIGRHWRTLEPQFMKGLLEVLLLNAVYHDWPLDGLKASDVLPIMAADGFSEKLVRHCLAEYGVEMPGLQEETWLLDQSKICIQYARELLLNNPRWKCEEFLEAWQRRLPPAIRPTLEMLAGEALVKTLGSQSWVRVFSRSSLPMKPAERFAALFKEQPKWVWEDLQHYISDLRVPGLSVEAMLLKYTRKTQPDAASPPVYNAR